MFSKRHFLQFKLHGKSPYCLTEFCCVVEFLIGFPGLDPAVVNEVRSLEKGSQRGRC